MNKEAILNFVAAALFALSGSIDLLQGEAFDLGSGLAYLVAAIFVFVGFRAMSKQPS
jgi:hypothetical protein